MKYISYFIVLFLFSIFVAPAEIAESQKFNLEISVTIPCRTLEEAANLEVELSRMVKNTTYFKDATFSFSIKNADCSPIRIFSDTAYYIMPNRPWNWDIQLDSNRIIMQ